MFFRFFQFIKGYAILRIKGQSKDVTLEKIRKSGVLAREITCSGDEITLTVDYDGFCVLKESCIEFDIVSSHGGVFFLEKIKKHPVLLGGIFLTILTFFLGSNFIWTVEYQGVSSENMEQISIATQKAGVTIGALKSRLMTPLELKNTILANTEGISWCWVYIKGTKAVVDVRENSIAPMVFDPNLPCHIVASKDGMLKKVTAKRGTCIRAINTPVSVGDVIISGQVTYGEDGGYAVHAKGICEATTHYERECVYKLYRNYKNYTGKKRNFYALKLFSLRIPLYFNGDVDYAYCDKEEKVYEISLGYENYIGIGLEKVSFFEYNIKKEPISRELCEKLAKEELEAEIAKELLPGSVKTGEDLATKIIDDETISVRLTMEFTENIAAEKIIEEVTIFEPKTD